MLKRRVVEGISVCVVKAEQVQKSVQWYAEAFEGGMGIAGRGLRAYYQEGWRTRIPPDQRNFLLTLQQGAELGYPDWMFHWAFELYFHLGRKQEGLDYARRAAEQGHLKGWMILGHAYRYGNVAEQSFSKARPAMRRAWLLETTLTPAVSWESCTSWAWV